MSKESAQGYDCEYCNRKRIVFMDYHLNVCPEKLAGLLPRNQRRKAEREQIRKKMNEGLAKATVAMTEFGAAVQKVAEAVGNLPVPHPVPKRKRRQKPGA